MNDNLDKEERDILDSFNRGEWQSVPKLAQRKQEIRQAIQATLQKEKRVVISNAENDSKIPRDL